MLQYFYQSLGNYLNEKINAAVMFKSNYGKLVLRLNNCFFVLALHILPDQIVYNINVILN